MAARTTSSPPTFGFLTVIEDPEHGLFGGYLALNAGGRPLEFHCTAPVKPNRAQEILYGPSLMPFVQGELIGGALLARAKTTPLVVCTDQAPAIALRRVTEAPVLLVLGENDEPEGDRLSTAPVIRTERHTTAKVVSGSRWIRFQIGNNKVAVSATDEQDRARIEESCGSMLADFDLQEPFSRIREALQEARNAAASPAARAPRVNAAA